MNYPTFIATVRETGGYIDHDETEAAIRAVLGTLGRRLGGPSAHKLAAQLPGEAGTPLTGAEGPPSDWDVEEFCDQVAETAGSDEEEGTSATIAVLSSVADTISDDELGRILSQLPTAYADLFGHPELS